MRNILLSFFSVAFALLAWELAGRAGAIDIRFFPPPMAILQRLCEALANEGLGMELLVSLRRALLGSLIALPLALGLALASELSPAVGAVLRPWVSFLYPLPKLALFPLLLMLFGLGEGSKLALVAAGVFFLVYLNACLGIRRILQSEYYDIAVVYRIPLAPRLVKVLLWGALPEILSGIKLGLGYALVMVIAAEFTASKQGIGVYIWNAWDRFRILDLYAGLVLCACVGWVIFQACGLLERAFSRYE